MAINTNDLTFTALTALLLSIVSLIVAYKSYQRNYYKNALIKRLDHALDINKLIIANPDLLTIYDKYSDTISIIDSKRLPGLQEAAFDFFLLTWENVVNDIKDQNTEEWLAWKASIDELFIESTTFRLHVQRIIADRPIFPEKFKMFLAHRLEKTEQLYKAKKVQP